MTDPDPVAPLLDLLRPEYSADYWADEIAVQAAMTLEALSDEAWARLEQAITAEPAGARARLATALRHAPSDRTTELLVALLRSAEPEVGVAATTSLFEQYHFWLPMVSLRDELQRHLRTAGPELGPQIEALLARVTD